MEAKIQKLLPKTEQLKKLLAQGIETRQELRYYLEDVSEKGLNKLLTVLKISLDENDLSVENIWHKFIHKQRIRYAQLLKIKEKADEKSNLYIQLQAIKAMMEIDKDIVKIGQELGLIFKQPDMLELKLPPEVQKFQDELKELEIQYFKLTGKKSGEENEKFAIPTEIRPENQRCLTEGTGKTNNGDEGKDRGGEEKEVKETTPILAL